MRSKEFLLEVTVTVDANEVDTKEKAFAKEKEIREAIESLDSSIGIFLAETCLLS